MPSIKKLHKTPSVPAYVPIIQSMLEVLFRKTHKEINKILLGIKFFFLSKEIRPLILLSLTVI